MRDHHELDEHMVDALELATMVPSARWFVEHLRSVDTGDLGRRYGSQLEALRFSGHANTLGLLTHVLLREGFDAAIVPDRLSRLVLRAKARKTFLGFDKRQILKASLFEEERGRLREKPKGIFARIGESLVDSDARAARLRNLSFVLGCQRSGTTLLFMMLTSHPSIEGQDEKYSRNRFPTRRELLKSQANESLTCYKLPARTHDLRSMKVRHPHAKIVWVVRHPHAVISSMRKYRPGEGTVSWLTVEAWDELRRHRVLFPEIDGTDPAAMTEIEIAAHLWNYKARALRIYRERDFDVLRVKYEDLLASPKQTLGVILNFLGLPWDDCVLQHEQVHGGRLYAGRTTGTDALDPSRATPDLSLTEEEKGRISEICGEEMIEHGYLSRDDAPMRSAPT